MGRFGFKIDNLNSGNSIRMIDLKNFFPHPSFQKKGFKIKTIFFEEEEEVIIL